MTHISRMPMAIAMVVVISIGTPSAALGFGPYPFPAQVIVMPSVPTPAQNVILSIADTFSGQQENCGALSAVDTTRSGNVFDVEATIVIDCSAQAGSTDAGDHTAFEVDLGKLSAGRYTVNYNSAGAQSDVPGFHRVSLTFSVSPTLPRVIEYYNSKLDHYFMTLDPEEIAKLDDGEISGWRRTGGSFGAIEPETGRIDLRAVCRFYGVPEAGLDSHFFTADNAECAAVKHDWPDQWMLETDDAFLVSPSYLCDAGTVPLYRLYDGRPDANHRYITSTQVRDEMIAAGWIVEGSGVMGTPEPHVMCVRE